MRAMRETSNRSIIVFEDIDCNSEVHDRSKPDKFANLDSDSDLLFAKVCFGAYFTFSLIINVLLKYIFVSYLILFVLIQSFNLTSFN
jgi:hypothetical protein